MTGEGVSFDKAKINAIANALKVIASKKKSLEIGMLFDYIYLCNIIIFNSI